MATDGGIITGTVITTGTDIITGMVMITGMGIITGIMITGTVTDLPADILLPDIIRTGTEDPIITGLRV